MDLRQIKNLMKEFEDSKIQKLEINDKEFSIKLEKESTVIHTTAPVMERVQQPLPVAEASAPTQQEVVVNDNVEVKAPLVGTFYAAPSPDSEPFVKVGQTVKEGDVLFIIEAMKVMNEITSPAAGTVAKINVQDGTMVEFGEVVLEIKE